jgi:hypothetical protein
MTYYITGKYSQLFFFHIVTRIISMKKYQHLNSNLDYHMKADLTLNGDVNFFQFYFSILTHGYIFKFGNAVLVLN